MRRMNGERAASKFFGRRRRRRRKERIREKGANNMEWIDREEWRRKIELKF